MFTVHCDECGVLATSVHYHCNTCRYGDFDLYQHCVSQVVVHCFDAEHQLAERTFVNGSIVNTEHSANSLRAQWD